MVSQLFHVDHYTVTIYTDYRHVGLLMKIDQICIV